MSRYEEALKKSQEADAKRIQEMEELRIKVESGELSPRDEKKALKEIAKVEKMQKKSAFWGNLAEKADSNGRKLQETGKSMQKAGLKTTAVVWTPAIYAGYKIAKNVKGKSAESDLVTLVKECEQAHAEGKITEAEMKEYVVSFVDNYYRK